MTRSVEAALCRIRLTTLIALVLLTLLAWAWLFAGAGMGMDMVASLLPQAPLGGGMPMGGEAMMPGWTFGRLALTFSMWWIMMVAMMLPSAAPTILLFARASAAQGQAPGLSIECFLSGYLLAWAGFSLLATLLQFALDAGGLLLPALMAVHGKWALAGLLVLAGLYQLTPFKNACLSHCRNPAQFLSRHYRPGLGGALRMGLVHGAFCVGCCWPLMLLLFIGGVMNMVWILLLTLLVAGEKLLPFGQRLSIVMGALCILGGSLIATA